MIVEKKMYKQKMFLEIYTEKPTSIANLEQLLVAFSTTTF